MLSIKRNGSLEGDSIKKKSLQELTHTCEATWTWEKKNKCTPWAYLHMCSASIIPLRSRFPPVCGTSQRDEKGDANDSNKLGLVTNNREKKGRVSAGGEQGSAQKIIIYVPPEATSGKAT